MFVIDAKLYQSELLWVGFKWSRGHVNISTTMRIKTVINN